MIRREHMHAQVQINALKSHMYDMNVCDARACILNCCFYNKYICFACEYFWGCRRRRCVAFISNECIWTTTRVKILRISNILLSLYCLLYSTKILRKKKSNAIFVSEILRRVIILNTTYTVQKEMSCASSSANVP